MQRGTGDSWLTNTSAVAYYFHPPGTGPHADESFDSTNGFMARTVAGASHVWRIYVPEDGLYRVSFRGTITTRTTTIYRQFSLLWGTATDYDPLNSRYVFATSAPSRVTPLQYAGGLESVVALRRDDAVFAVGAAGLDYYLADDAQPGLTSLTVRWIGRYP
ncbi:hypothetical protein [Streptomyces ginkgonis]|uniref:hypothetical protein n=1 Tax=Streptomyces ginkgonis TaxID=1812259 RepID=UPI002176E068|nr:hypothetical protein [Streptomyces ginkgonis]